MQVTNPNRIRELRQLAGLEARDLAVLLNISEGMIFRYERGESRPDIDKALAMARRFGVTVEYLMGADTEAAA